MFSIDYKDEFPIDQIEPGETVYIVDFSVPPEMMTRLLSVTDDVHWIDHHKTSIQMYDGYLRDIPGLRVLDSPSGCECTWRYLYPDVAIPRGVELIGDRDTWTWKYGDETKYFHFGLQAKETSPESPIWGFLFSPDTGNEIVEDMIRAGHAISCYDENRWAEYKKNLAFEVSFEGYRCIAMNSGMCGSQAFGENDYDIMIPFVRCADKHTVSLYSTKIDVSEIAKKYGGGGHVKAAGFTCKELPF
jgi:oligoribonuclease NrnB/cAMP/cGMP phosphodiesterase (DHH superfamily)